MARRKRRSFTPEYKAEAVRLVQVGDRSVREVAKALDLTETALREWAKGMIMSEKRKVRPRERDRVGAQYFDRNRRDEPWRTSA